MAGKLDAANAVKAKRKRATLLGEALVAASGATPKDVMIRTMRDLVEDADKARSPVTRRRLMRAASDVAKDAAPYVHPKLQSIIHEGGDKPIQITEVRRVIVRP